MMLTAERLRELMHYDPETGIFRWLKRNSFRVVAVGDIAGSSHSGGYIEIGVDGQSYLAHRLAWLYMTGKWPSIQIDHINGDRQNNRFANLRDVTRRANTQNRKKHVTSRTGLLGVAPVGKKFRCKINVAGKQIYLGTYETAELAFAAYVAAKRQWHEGCTL